MTDIQQQSTNNNEPQQKGTDVATDNPPPEVPDESGDGAGAGMPPGEQSTAATIADSLIEAMPEVQQHAVDQAAEEATMVANRWSDIKGADGSTFDPAIHQVKKDGSPVLSRKGNCVRKRGTGRVSSTGVVTPRRGSAGPASTSKQSVVGGASVGSRSTSDQPQQAAVIAARTAGVAAANALIGLGVGLGGEEWSPRTEKKDGLDERDMLENAFGDYFVAKGMEDIPPGIALVIGIGCYAIPRFTMPKTQSRLSKLKGKLASWWVRRRDKKRNLKNSKNENNAKNTDKKDEKAPSESP